MVEPIPSDYRRVTPYLIVDGASDAIEFYSRVFGAEERMRMPAPEGKVGHAELDIGDAVIMLADEFPEMGAVGPRTVGGSPVSLMIYVEDVDAVFASALEAGATERKAIEDKFYGDRSGDLEDPFGHRWTVSTHVEDLTGEQIAERMSQMG